MPTTTDTPANTASEAGTAPTDPPKTTGEALEAAASLLISMSYIIKMQTGCIAALAQGRTVPEEMLLTIKLEEKKLTPGLRMMIARLKEL